MALSPSTYLISIIIPVYNREKYLRECLDSAINQTYHNLQIICVDDASTDSSAEILREYAAADPRIEVIELAENKGVANARNIGLEHVRGDYIAWLDSDDIYHPQFIETMLDQITKYNCDIIECNTVNFSDIVHPNKISSISITISDNVDFMKRFGNNVLQTSLWSKLFKRDLFDGFKFPIGKLYEEPYFYFEIFNKLKTIGYLNAVLYYYRDNPVSIMNGMSNSRIESNIAIHNYLLSKASSGIPYANLTYSKVLTGIVGFWKKSLYAGAYKSQLRAIGQQLEDALKLNSKFNVPVSRQILLISKYNNQLWFQTLLRIYNSTINKYKRQ